MGYIVIFKRLAGIPNVALLVRPIVRVFNDIAQVIKHFSCSPCSMVSVVFWYRSCCGISCVLVSVVLWYRSCCGIGGVVVSVVLWCEWYSDVSGVVVSVVLRYELNLKFDARIEMLELIHSSTVNHFCVQPVTLLNSVMECQLCILSFLSYCSSWRWCTNTRTYCAISSANSCCTNYESMVVSVCTCESVECGCIHSEVKAVLCSCVY